MSSAPSCGRRVVICAESASCLTSSAQRAQGPARWEVTKILKKQMRETFMCATSYHGDSDWRCGFAHLSPRIAGENEENKA